MEAEPPVVVDVKGSRHAKEGTYLRLLQLVLSGNRFERGENFEIPVQSFQSVFTGETLSSERESYDWTHVDILS